MGGGGDEEVGGRGVEVWRLWRGGGRGRGVEEAEGRGWRVEGWRRKKLRV